MTEVEEAAHAILSPSFMHVALECAGSVGFKESLPPEPPGLPAIKGTKIHEGASIHLSDFLDHKIHGSDPDIRAHLLLEEEVKKVAVAWTTVIWKEAFEKSITGKFYGIEEKLIFSEKFSIWGTTDFWLISTDERAKPYGMVCDLKSGFVYVDAAKNPQLAAYACALRKTARDAGKDLDYVRAAIFQPFGEGDKWRETKFTGKQLDGWEKRFLKLAETVYSGKSKYRAGEHCQYCPAGRGRGVCKAYDKYLTKETGLRMLDPTEVVFPPVQAIPHETLVRIISHEKQLETFIKGCRKELLNQLMQGSRIEGVKLVEARTRRKWDETKLPALDKVLAGLGLNLHEIVTKGITDIKDALAEKIGKKESDALLKDFLVSPKGGIVLADTSDSRDEVTPTHGLFTEE